MSLVNLDQRREDAPRLKIDENLSDLLCPTSNNDLKNIGDDRVLLLDRARHVKRLRQEQKRLFPAQIFRESSWDILLNCYVAELEGRHLCVKQLHADLDESNTAMLRRLADLERLGLIARSRDDQDGRRTNVRLTQSAVDLIRQFLERYDGAI